MSNSRDIADSAATINFIDTVTSNVQDQIDNVDSLPTQSGQTGKFLTTNGSAASWATLVTDPTLGTLTQTFASGQTSTISLTSSVLAPVVTVTKEVSQAGSTNNTWDVNSTSQNYTRLDSAPATTLDWTTDLANASFVDSFSISPQDTSPKGLTFNSDGTKMFVIGGQGKEVNQYALTTGFDVSTASYVRVLSISAQFVFPVAITFNSSGTKMIISGLDTGYVPTVGEYTLSTGFDISTATLTDTLSVATNSAGARGSAFNSDGTKMFIVGQTAQNINEYSLSTGFDISTASFVDGFNITSQTVEPDGIAFNAAGTILFVVGANNDTIFKYTLSTAFDISTASYSSISFSVASQEATPTGISFNPTTSKMFVTGTTGRDVNEYNLTETLALGTGSFAAGDVGKTIEANSGVFVLTATTGTYVQTTAPTSFNQVASGSWEMYGLVYNTTDGDLELSSYKAGFNISTAVYATDFSVTAQDTSPRDMTFNPDGTKMFVTGTAGVDINEYTLSVAFDLSSTVTFVARLSLAGQDNDIRSVKFSSDGTKMFMLGAQGVAVYAYTLTTAFTVSTTNAYIGSFSVASQQSDPYGLAFSSDGTKMFVGGNDGDEINEYSLSTGFDISTASFVDVLYVGSTDTNPLALTFSADGTKMFFVGGQNDSVYRYNLTAWDVSTAVYDSAFSVAGYTATPYGIAIDTDGNKMFVVNQGGTVQQYTLTSTFVSPSGYQPVHTTTSTDTQYWTDINSMTANQAAGTGNIYYAISTDDRTIWSVIKDVGGERDIVRNNGGTWQYNSNSTYGSETWAAGTTNTELATLAQAMEPILTGGAFDVSTSVYSQNFSVSAQDTSPMGIAFNANGTKMFVVGNAGQDVNEYALSTGFDVSTASYSQNFSVSSQDTYPIGLGFNTNGTKMFVVGYTGKDVNEYALSTGFDVSTASFTDSFSVAAEITAPSGLCFNPDGTKMFILDFNYDARDVSEYTLSTGFDVSTSSYVDSFSMGSQDTSPMGIAFNADGTTMFMVGNDVDNVNTYTLTTGFDVSTASFTSAFSVAAQDTVPKGIAFNSDGLKMYIVGTSNDSVFEYSLGTFSTVNQMDKTQLDAVTDPNHIALSNDLDLAIVLNLTSGTTVPSSNGVSINYDANVLNKAAVLGTDYDYDAPAQNKVRFTALAANNLKVRVL